MPELHVSHPYPVNAECVWQRIRDFTDIRSWLPGVTACEMQGEGVGAIRTLTVMDGSQVREKLEALDEDRRSFSYSIVEAPGFSADQHYRATVHVESLDDNRCQVHWSATFEGGGAPPEKVEKARQRAERMYAFCLSNLEQLL